MGRIKNAPKKPLLARGPKHWHGLASDSEDCYRGNEPADKKKRDFH